MPQGVWRGTAVSTRCRAGLPRAAPCSAHPPVRFAELPSMAIFRCQTLPYTAIFGSSSLAGPFVHRFATFGRPIAQRSPAVALGRCGATGLRCPMRHRAFHGSPSEAFSTFDPARTGRASGYAHAQDTAAFTSAVAVAEHYAGPDGFVGEFAFVLDHPLECDDRDRPMG